MMKLNRKEIIKALECCHTNSEIDCRDCPYWNKVTDLYDGCVNTLVKNAFALIKELTEENERLRAEMDRYEAVDKFRSALMDNFIDVCRGNDYNKINLLLIGDIVDRIYDKCIDDMRKKDDLNQIAKEMLEGEK